MIYFDNQKLLKTANYYAQQMFMQNSGDQVWALTVPDPKQYLAAACVGDSRTGDIIVKVVNAGTNAAALQLDLAAVGKPVGEAIITTLCADLGAHNTFEHPDIVSPRVATAPAAELRHYTAPAASLTVLRFKTR